jgi:hypothetical protein
VRLLVVFCGIVLLGAGISVPEALAADVPWEGVVTDTYQDCCVAYPRAQFADDGPTAVAAGSFVEAWSALHTWFSGFRPDESRDKAIAALAAVDFRTHAVIALAVPGSCLDELRVGRVFRQSAIVYVTAKHYDTKAPYLPGAPGYACLAISYFNVHIVAVPRWLNSDHGTQIIARVDRAAPDVVELGGGLGGLRLGMRYERRWGLRFSELYTRNRRPGCVGHPDLATRLDHYPRLRLGWTDGELTNVATRVIGHRSQTGFAIGTATFDQVRRRFPTARVYRGSLAGSQYASSKHALGRSLIVISRPTAHEQWVTTNYWFDREGSLVAIETMRAGC